MDSEKRITDILNSLDGMQKAEPSPYLYTKIQTRLADNFTEKISLKWRFASLTLIIILILINISIIKTKENKINQNETKEFISTQQELNSNQIY